MVNRKIVQYSLSGEFIKIHDSVYAAMNSVGLKSHSGIIGCCKFKSGSNSTAGYQWRYYEENNVCNNIGTAIKRGYVYKQKYGSGTEAAAVVNNKKIDTLLSKSGFPHPMMDPETKERYKMSCMLKYGETNPAKSNIVKEKISKTERSKKTDNFISLLRDNILFNSVTDDDIFNLTDNTCLHSFDINRQLLTVRSRNFHTICTVCNPIDFNQKSEIERYLFDRLSSDVTNIHPNVRGLVDGKHEIDIFLKDFNIGIEVNDIKFHSEEYGKFKNHHLSKTEMFNSNGIFLYHFFDDEVSKKSDIIRSMVLNKIGKSKKIHARKCTISKIKNKESLRFLSANHMQGPVNSEYCYGLFYNGLLVSVMTFSKLRKYTNSVHNEGHFELLRFCNVINVSVIGGASRLLKTFINEIQPIKIISYANRRWSDGSLYCKLGFNFDCFTEPGYYFFYKNKRINRTKLRRSALIKLGCDDKLTTNDMLIEIGAYKIWDCGNYKFSMDLI